MYISMKHCTEWELEIRVDKTGTMAALRYEFLLYTCRTSGSELQTETVIVTGLTPEILAAQINY